MEDLLYEVVQAVRGLRLSEALPDVRGAGMELFEEINAPSITRRV